MDYVRFVCYLILKYSKIEAYDSHQETALVAKMKDIEDKITLLNGIYGHSNNLPITDEFSTRLSSA